MKKHIITFAGHIALAILHRYLMEVKGISVSQFVTFFVAHFIWHYTIMYRIYGLK